MLFDLPRVIDEARLLASTERLRLEPGDFFKDALPACDGYVVMDGATFTWLLKSAGYGGES